MRKLEINGGQVIEKSGASHLRLTVPLNPSGYCDAQIDDYAGLKRSDYPWSSANRSVQLSLDASFSHPIDELRGTAGFGFWNAPFGDPTVPFPTLPKAVWFFFGSKPNDLPLNISSGPGRGFFANTLDATTWRALSMAPFAPFVVLLNRIPRFKRSVWPKVQNRLGISYHQIDCDQIDITKWHSYQLDWSREGVRFLIDHKPVLQTNHSPTGRLGFVCWIDNQFMQVTPTGRTRVGTIPLPFEAWMEIKNLSIKNS